MSVILRIVLSVPLVSLAFFSIFGFMATFEPLEADTQMTWRVIYVAMFVVSIAGLILINRHRKQTANDQKTNTKSP